MFSGLSDYLKKILPKRLFYRALLIVAIPVLVLQLVIAIVFFDPMAIEASRALSPTPPSPTTAILSSSLAFAVLITAPTPVTTPQPKRAACSKGMCLSILTSASLGRTAYSAKPATPE